MQQLTPNLRHSSLSGTAVKQSSEGSRNLVCTFANYSSLRTHVLRSRAAAAELGRLRGPRPSALGPQLATLTV